ncbi:MAG: LamG domain-containing protein, partial [Candidatus Paceibacterota bacterium]
MNKLLKQAFTLIELLVVIAIIGILSGLIIVAINGITNSATIAKTKIFSNSLRNSLLMNFISEWKFNGTTSDGLPANNNDVLDTWKNINNGVVFTVPPIVRTGPECVSGSCLQFGSSNYVSFGSNPSLSMGLGDQTISLWAKFDNPYAPTNETLAVCGATSGTATGDDGYWIMRYNGTSRLIVFFSDGDSARISPYLSATGKLVANTWYNIVVVFDRDTVVQAYINGVKQPESANISSLTGDLQNKAILRIGGEGLTTNRIVGKIDEIALYSAVVDR